MASVALVACLAQARDPALRPSPIGDHVTPIERSRRGLAGGGEQILVAMYPRWFLGGLLVVNECSRHATMPACAVGHALNSQSIDCLTLHKRLGLTFAVGNGSDPVKAAEYSKENLDIYDYRLTSEELKPTQCHIWPFTKGRCLICICFLANLGVHSVGGHGAPQT